MSQEKKIQVSADICSEFLDYAINNILYQRGLYPPEDFKTTRKYNLSLLTTTNEKIQNYLNQILQQLDSWFNARKISKIVLVISSKETRLVLERWQFDLVVDANALNKENDAKKSTKEINSEISAIMRQITASVSFLPMLEPGECTFNILAYTDKDAQVPATWIDSDAREITKDAVQQVKLRGFATDVHKIDALVSYRVDE